MKRALLLTLSLFSFFVSVFFIDPQVVHAQNKNPSAELSQKKFNDEAQGKSANINQTALNFFDATMHSGILRIAGDGSNGVGGQNTDAGAIPGVARMISYTYMPPASVGTYVADLLQNMRLVQPAYAQGLGFSALQPVLQLWKLFRNIAYVFFVFIFLIIGFAIMFRKNLGGQTAVTVQQALPRIIVALLAVSFSYAMAGLVIDFMWLLMYFLITMFNASGLMPASVSQYSILNDNIFGLFGRVLSTNFVAEAGQVIGHAVDAFLNIPGAELRDAPVGWLSAVLTELIIFVAILFAVIRTFFSLIKIYLEIILSIVFAPIILMLGAINGNAFGNWLKGLVANLAVFPALLVFVLIGLIMLNVGDPNATAEQNALQGGFVPPFIPGGGQAKNIGLIGGLAAIMLLPEVTAIVGKFKPAGIFDEFGPKIFNQLKTANRFAMPVAGAGLGAVGNPLLQGGSAAWQSIKGVGPNKSGGGGSFADYFGAARRGMASGFTRQNVRAGLGKGFAGGNILVRREEDALEGRLQDANNLASVVQSFASRDAREKAAAERAKKEADSTESPI